MDGDDTLTGQAFRFAHRVRRTFAAQMEDERWAQDAGLRRGCYGVLRVIHGSGDRVSQKDVADRFHISPSEVVDLVDRLETAGFVERVRDPDDRRRNVLELTPDGERAVARFHAVAERVDAELLAPLTAAERETFGRLLGKVVRGR